MSVGNHFQCSNIITFEGNAMMDFVQRSMKNESVYSMISVYLKAIFIHKQKEMSVS